MKDLVRDAMSITVSKDSDRVLVTWRGVSDAQSPAQFLNPYFDELADEITGCSCRLDLVELTYMNSSSVSPLMRLVQKLESLGIPTEIVFSSTIEWQKTSSRAFNIVAMRLAHVSVTVED